MRALGLELEQRAARHLSSSAHSERDRRATQASAAAGQCEPNRRSAFPESRKAPLHTSCLDTPSRGVNPFTRRGPPPHSAIERPLTMQWRVCLRDYGRPQRRAGRRPPREPSAVNPSIGPAADLARTTTARRQMDRPAVADDNGDERSTLEHASRADGSDAFPRQRRASETSLREKKARTFCSIAASFIQCWRSRLAAPICLRFGEPVRTISRRIWRWD
ncbi:hypothetical protein MRX96_009779 [Rhipicephalus microplus]